jgi:hypothetical protein
MNTARFTVPWDDFDYESWVRDCGAQLAKLEPRLDGGFDAFVEGSPAAIEAFAQDLGYPPAAVE